MSKWSVHDQIKVTASLVATVCVPAKLGHVFVVGSLGCAQKSFGEVATFLFWARTKLHKQVLQKMATPVYYATHCNTYASLIYCPQSAVVSARFTVPPQSRRHSPGHNAKLGLSILDFIFESGPSPSATPWCTPIIFRVL